MKTQPFLFAIVLLTLANISYGQNFKKLSSSTDSTYGYSANNPLKTKDGTPGEGISYAKKFLNGLKTMDDQDLVLLGRNSMRDPNFKATRDFQLGDGGVLDRYSFVTSVTKDTIRIYVDIYHREKLKLPVGLKYVGSE